MNWRLIILLSLTGPALATAGIFGLVGFKYEPHFVFGLFMLFSILFSLKRTGNYFMHAFITAVIFGLSMSVIRLIFLVNYIIQNPEAVDKVEAFLQQIRFIRSPLIILGGLILISALIAGIMSWLISKLLRNNR